ncbi:hypothetical protein G4B88_008143 [Cannabis sativa]|uniref:Zinc knuckle CX2CX4HX4C domain-containing protein n=1 Tax=Cannabis sativa TaxID=3483 RepID=A0A7J6I7G0_CANSA|nr:hypothetical protein G4B88_008143 [Cannabis sativa]
MVNGDFCWVQFKYEKVSNFCYMCGQLVHQRSGCSLVSSVTILDAHGIPFPLYGPWSNTSSMYQSCLSRRIGPSFVKVGVEALGLSSSAKTDGLQVVNVEAAESCVESNGKIVVDYSQPIPLCDIFRPESPLRYGYKFVRDEAIKQCSYSIVGRVDKEDEELASQRLYLLGMVGGPNKIFLIDRSCDDNSVSKEQILNFDNGLHCDELNSSLKIQDVSTHLDQKISLPKTNTSKNSMPLGPRVKIIIDIGVQPSSEIIKRTTPIKNWGLDFKTFLLGRKSSLRLRRVKRVVRDFPMGLCLPFGVENANLF